MASNQGNQGNQGGNQGGDTSNRGFASMDPQKQREIASEGGKAAHGSGNAQDSNSQVGRETGSKSHGGGNQGGGSAQGGNNNSGGNSGGTRGGSSEQHAEAGRQSHKNDR